MNRGTEYTRTSITKDIISGLVVFLVALPLCLGIALASDAPAFSGIVAGILGGLVVGVLSGSHTSVSGPAAGLTAIVAAQIHSLGSLPTFFLAVMIGGVIQLILGAARAGGISAFVPSSVIKGLLAAIGVILILKQIPHLVGHDTDPEGEMSFIQPDNESTFSELAEVVGDLHPGAAAVGAVSLLLLIVWGRNRFLKKSIVPAPLIVVLMGVAMQLYFERLGGVWQIQSSHLVQVPVSNSMREFFGFFILPDFSQLANPAVYVAGFTIAIVASLETLLNLEAVDKIDPKQRRSPPNRELFAQGVGNVLSGLLGGLPMTSVIVRSSVNINAGGQSRIATIFHGALLVGCVMMLPQYLNYIPLSSLAAILLMTGIKLASPALVRQMWSEGRYQFIPFIITLVSIVLTDLLIGILVGLGVSVAFILNSNLRRPIRRVIEKHLGGDVLHVELGNQVSFLNRAALEEVLHGAPAGSHVLLDATSTDYIDPDVLSLIREFKHHTGPIRKVQVSLKGFRQKYQLQDEIQFVDYSTRELQEQMTPQQALQVLHEGNERFLSGRRLSRDFGRQVNATSQGQHPIAVVLSCIDSRTPAELILDMGLGDIFSVRIAGNVISPKVLGSIEYGCVVAGAKLVLVLGHTRCGAVTSAVSLAGHPRGSEFVTGCQHVEAILGDIEQAFSMDERGNWGELSSEQQAAFVDHVAKRNVERVVSSIVHESPAIRRLLETGQVAVVGGMYDISTGKIDFWPEAIVGLDANDLTDHSSGALKG